MPNIDVYRVKLVKEKSVDVENAQIIDAEDAKDVINLVLEINDDAVEKFGIICLNAQRYVVGVHLLAVGNINSVHIPMNQLFLPAGINNAVCILLFHNHPGGDPTPSRADFEQTMRMKKMGESFGIAIVDHIIVSHDKYYSMKEHGDMDFNLLVDVHCLTRGKDGTEEYEVKKERRIFLEDEI